MADVAFVTYEDLTGIHEQDVPLAEELTKLGLEWTAVPWSAPVSWREHRVALLRATWDYHKRLPEFLAWVERASRETKLVNPPEIARWNADKRYLRDLAKKGVPIVPTEWIDARTRVDLRGLLASKGWDRAVVKPAVSGGGWRTIRASPANLAEAQAHLDALVAERDVMIQPYLDSIEGYGERSIVWIDGQVTHGMRKTPAFLGGDAARYTGVPVLAGAPEAEPATPSPEEVKFALDALGKIPHGGVVYARIDVAPGPLLMELELLEPTLYFKSAPHAAARMAEALKRLCR